MMRWTIRTAGLLALATLAGCSGGTAPAGPASSSTTTTTTTAPTTVDAVSSVVTTTTTTSTGATAPTTTVRKSTPTTTTTSPAPGAVRALAPFLAAAGRADAALSFTAARTRANLQDAKTTLQPATAQSYEQAHQAVESARLAIPAGLDARLLRPAILVYSDLDARDSRLREYRNALAAEGDANEYHQYALAVLKDETKLAARFPGDLAELRAAAAAHQPVTVQPHSSLAGAELAVRLRGLYNRNWCGDGSGGQVLTKLDELSWTHRPKNGRAEGLMFGDTPFTATLTKGRWAVNIEPC